MPDSTHIQTRVLHDSNEPESEFGATVVPIYQNASFAYDTAEEMEAVFAGREAGYVYSRITNPGVAAFERRMAALESGIACVACASGMAAVSTTALALAGAGDEIVSGNSIFGGTRSLFAHTLARYGITTRFVESTDIQGYRQALNPRTRMIFVETIGNPKLDVPDLPEIANLAKEHGVPLVVDNTATTPVLCDAKKWGADIVVHSTSKYLNGHGNAIGGAVIDCGTFDWGSDRFAHLAEYRRRVGQFAFVAALRSRIHRDLGGCLSPFNAFLTGMGLDTLALRMERHCANALRVAEFLAADSRVDEVRHPGLLSHPDHATARRILPEGAGALLTLRLGSKQRCFQFINALARVRNVANLGDTKTLVIHPASTFCRDADESERIAMGVTDDLVRLSIGIEHADDIIADIDQALNSDKTSTKRTTR